MVTDSLDRLARLAADSVQAPEGAIVAVGRDHDHWLGAGGRPAVTLAHLVTSAGAPVVLPDLATAADGPVWLSGASAHLRAFLGVPVRGRDGRILGALGVGDTTPRSWTAREVQFLSAIAETAASVVALISERGAQHGADARFRAAAREFKTLAEHTPDVIARFDREHRHLYVNAAIERATGIPRHEWIGKTHADLGHPPDVVAQCGEALTAVFTTGAPTEFHAEYPSPDGRRWYECRLVPEFAGDGAVATVLWLGRDVTEQRRADRALAEREAYYRALIEHVGEAVTVVDAEGIVRYTTPAVARLIGVPASRYVGRSWLDGVHPDDLPSLTTLLADLVAHPGGSRLADYRRNDATGQWRTCAVIATNLLDDPAVGGIVINSRDVTARLQLEQQVRQSQKMEALGQLAGGVAHDFNNLLTVIGASCDFLRMDLDDVATGTDGIQGGHADAGQRIATMRADIDDIRQTAVRAAALTAQLLAFSRQQVVNPVVLDLNAAVRGVEGLLRRVLHEGITLSCLAAPCGAWVLVDRGQAEQVLLNLAVNARDAMPGGGALSIETGCLTVETPLESPMGPIPSGRYVTLSVRDTGVGMDDATRARIFEPFFTTKREGQGTGLGLATVYGIVQQSNGYLTVTSAPERGTTFTTYLPAVASSTAETGEQVDAEARVPAPSDASTTILVVEDEQSVRTVLRRILQAQGYRVLDARHGADALLIVQRAGDAIDLVLTDMVMPEMGGAELLAALQTLRPTLPAIIMSGYTPDSAAPLGQGARDTLALATAQFLPKPFTTDAVLSTVREVLDRRMTG